MKKILILSIFSMFCCFSITKAQSYTFYDEMSKSYFGASLGYNFSKDIKGYSIYYGTMFNSWLGIQIEASFKEEGEALQNAWGFSFPLLLQANIANLTFESGFSLDYCKYDNEMFYYLGTPIGLKFKTPPSFSRNIAHRIGFGLRFIYYYRWPMNKTYHKEYVDGFCALYYKKYGGAKTAFQFILSWEFGKKR